MPVLCGKNAIPPPAEPLGDFTVEAYIEDPKYYFTSNMTKSSGYTILLVSLASETQEYSITLTRSTGYISISFCDETGIGHPSAFPLITCI
jgi:hypothetical protein